MSTHNSILCGTFINCKNVRILSGKFTQLQKCQVNKMNLKLYQDIILYQDKYWLLKNHYHTKKPNCTLKIKAF